MPGPWRRPLAFDARAGPRSKERGPELLGALYFFMTDCVIPIDMPAATESRHSPDYRNVVHAGAFVLFAPLLGILADPRNGIQHGRWVVVGFMLCVTLWNILILPRQESGRVIRRPGESWVSGTWMYPLSLAAAFLFFPPFAAMAAWAVMAGGDACASFVGRRMPKPALPWNAKKSWAGFAGFIFGAAPFCVFALYWVPSLLFLKKSGSPELPYVWTLALIAALGGAVLESLDGPADDNIRVPLGVSLLLWPTAIFLSWATRDLPASTHVQPEFLIQAIFFNALLGAAVIFTRAGDIYATALGVAFGLVIYFFTHWQGYALFILFVAVGSGLSRVGRARKQELGTEEARGGKRGIGNVFANLAIPTACCLLFPVSKGHPALLLAYAGALAAAFADTASSEIGTLSPGQPRLITTRQPVPHGTNGAINLLGLAAATIAAALLGCVALATGFYELIGLGAHTAGCVAILVAAGVAGTLVDSLLGATIEGRVQGIEKGAVNFACTLTGAVVAGVLGYFL